MKSLPRFETDRTPCCSPSAAWVWVNAIGEMALQGEVTAHVVAGAVDHWLRMRQAVGAARPTGGAGD